MSTQQMASCEYECIFLTLASTRGTHRFSYPTSPFDRTFSCPILHFILGPPQLSMASAPAEKQDVVPRSTSSTLQSSISPSDSIFQVVGHQKNKRKSSRVYDEDDVTDELVSDDKNQLCE